MPGMPAIPDMALSKVARGIPIEVAASSSIESSSDAQQPARIVEKRDNLKVRLGKRPFYAVY